MAPWRPQTYSSIVNDRAEMELIDCSREHPSVKFDLKLIRGLLFTDSLIAPTTGERESPHLPRSEDGPPSPSWNSLLSRAESPDSPTDRTGTMSMNSLSREQSRLLWHMRLGHTNERLVSDLHKYADGIPDLPRGDVLDSCSICARSKLHKADRQPQEEKTADECWQHIQIDHGFIVQKSGSRAPSTSRKKTRARSHNQFRAAPATTVRPLTTSQRPSRSSRFPGSYSESHQRDQSRRTPRARHIEIQHFAIQEWRQHGDIILCHIPGILNPSDALTKALGYVLHHRHTKRSMGHYRLDSTNFGSNSIHFPRTIKAGEGVRAQESSDVGSSRRVTQEGTQGVPDTVIPPKTRSGERTQPHDESLWSQFEDAGGALPNAPHNVEKV